MGDRLPCPQGQVASLGVLLTLALLLLATTCNAQQCDTVILDMLS